MIVLNKIKVESIFFPNIFLTKSKGLEVIDILFNIDYELDEDKVDLERYNIDYEDLEKKTLEEIFNFYMVVPLEYDTYNKLNKMSYNDLEYLILSEMTSDFDEYNQFISDEQKKKAFNLIKDYIKSDEFKIQLETTFANGKQII